MNNKSKYNPNIHHRHSIRLKGYDYMQAGLYFITICVQKRESLFGQIHQAESRQSAKMILNDAGQMIEKWYHELEHKFLDIKCHEMIVMPNHFHCIIENAGSVRNAHGATVGADLRVCPNEFEKDVNPNEIKLGNPANDTQFGDYANEISGVNRNDLLGEHHGDLLGEHHGDLLGEHHGDLLGEHHGDLLGEHHGDLLGEHHGDLLGEHHGDLLGEHHGDLLGEHHGDILGEHHGDLLGEHHGDLLGEHHGDLLGEHHGDILGEHHGDILGEHHGGILGEHHGDILGEHRGGILGEHHGDILGEHVGSPLHRVVQWFKTMTTNEYIRGVKTLGWQRFNGKLWQRNYYEHIIRNEQSCQRISEYILNNPAKWAEDRFYK